MIVSVNIFARWIRMWYDRYRNHKKCFIVLTIGGAIIRCTGPPAWKNLVTRKFKNTTPFRATSKLYICQILLLILTGVFPPGEKAPNPKPPMDDRGNVSISSMSNKVMTIARPRIISCLAKKQPRHVLIPPPWGSQSFTFPSKKNSAWEMSSSIFGGAQLGVCKGSDPGGEKSVGCALSCLGFYRNRKAQSSSTGWSTWVPHSFLSLCTWKPEISMVASWGITQPLSLKFWCSGLRNKKLPTRRRSVSA